MRQWPGDDIYTFQVWHSFTQYAIMGSRIVWLQKYKRKRLHWLVCVISTDAWQNQLCTQWIHKLTNKRIKWERLMGRISKRKANKTNIYMCIHCSIINKAGKGAHDITCTFCVPHPLQHIDWQTEKANTNNLNILHAVFSLPSTILHSQCYAWKCTRHWKSWQKRWAHDEWIKLNQIF